MIDALRVAGVRLANVVAGRGAQHGWRPLGELEGEYAAREVGIEHPLLLIRLSDLSVGERELYRRTRQWWKLDRRRVETRELALGVYQGVVRSVYRIQRWGRPTAKGIERNPDIEGRWGFRGVPDPAAERHYIYADVTKYLPRRGGQYPIRYVDP